MISQSGATAVEPVLTSAAGFGVTTMSAAASSAGGGREQNCSQREKIRPCTGVLEGNHTRKGGYKAATPTVRGNPEGPVSSRTPEHDTSSNEGAPAPEGDQLERQTSTKGTDRGT